MKIIALEQNKCPNQTRCCNFRVSTFRGSTVIMVMTLIGLQELSRYPNVYCKASGMFIIDPKWDQKSVDLAVKPVLEYFGHDRSVMIVKTMIF